MKPIFPARSIRPIQCARMVAGGFVVLALTGGNPLGLAASWPNPMSKISVAKDGKGFVNARGERFVPFGANYFRPGTGWAPQVWKQFDEEATRRDFGIMRSLGMNCVRVFLTYGSFYQEPGKLSREGLEKFDRFLAIAEEHGIYVHPTGPDHWEGLPEWTRIDRLADERSLQALETFWTLLATHYRDRQVVFAYDLLNEPEVGWESPAMAEKWNAWLRQKYGEPAKVLEAWNKSGTNAAPERFAAPKAENKAGDPELLDYQRFREDVADEWTRRQAAAIRSADPKALVTVGLIQWSVPALLPGVRHYSGFNPQRQAKMLDFLEVHFYPLATGAYEYGGEEDELRNLAYLHAVVREVARPGKPVVVAEFGWYGGGKPNFDKGRHPFVSEEQQAQWCRKAVETTAGLATGWLNWGLYDQPQATDVSELSGMLRPDGTVKAWGAEASVLAGRLAREPAKGLRVEGLPALDWPRCVTSAEAGAQFRHAYLEVFQKAARVAAK